jgi:hypothetical protein
MGALAKWVGKLHTGKPVEPPTAPPPINMESTPFELPVPYALEEFPRTFLHLLLVAKDTPPQLKQDIQTWLTDYEEKLMTYMHTRYGDGADQVMDMITRSVMQQQHMTAAAKNKAAENDILSDLEKSLKEDSGGEAGTSTA